MPINLDLIDNGHILWFQVTGAWKTDEIRPAKEKTQLIFRQAHHPIQALLDLRGAKVNMALIKASQEVIGGEPLPNSGQIAVVGVPGWMRVLVEQLLRVTGNTDPITFFNSFEDAKTFLRDYIPDDES